eukprot:2197766-Amphidinium_carterae.1
MAITEGGQHARQAAAPGTTMSQRMANAADRIADPALQLQRVIGCGSVQYLFRCCVLSQESRARVMSQPAGYTPVYCRRQQRRPQNAI